MKATVPLVLFGWPLITLGLFLLVRPRTVVLTSFVAGWLLLPNAEYALPGLPEYDRFAAIVIPTLLGAVIFDFDRMLRALRFHWLDISIIALCFGPFATSIANGLGPYDGLSAVAGRLITWGFPYLLGKAYFSDPDGLKSLAKAICIGGLIYIPFCLWEIRFSPQLHRIIYGFHPFNFIDTRRLGGYRPSVLLPNGLALGMWMTVVTVTAIWLWRTVAVRRLMNLPVGSIAVALLVVTVLCRSLGALALLMLGLAVIFSAKWSRSAVVMLILLSASPAYIAIRATGVWNPQVAVTFVEENIDAQRARSLRERLEQEDVLRDRAWEQPVLGWGRWGRSRVFDDAGRFAVMTDGLWVIIFGASGLLGVVAWQGVAILPAGIIFRRIRGRELASPHYAALVALSLCVVLYTLDCLLNAMLNPVLHLTMGAIAGCAMHFNKYRQAAPRYVMARQERTAGKSLSKREEESEVTEVTEAAVGR